MPKHRCYIFFPICSLQSTSVVVLVHGTTHPRVLLVRPSTC